MIQQTIFGAERSEKNFRSSPDKTFVLPEVQPEMGRGVAVRHVFMHFQNLNLRILMEDLRHGQVTRGNWSFTNDLCPIAHGMPNGHTVGVLSCVSQAVDLPRACRLAAQELGVPPRFLERFLLTWDAGGMSQEWLLEQLEAIWAERLDDADTVQMVVGGEMLPEDQHALSTAATIANSQAGQPRQGK